MNLFIVPQSYTKFRNMQWDIRYNYSHILLREGAFNPVSEGVTVYVRQRTSEGQLLGVLVHDQHNKKNPETIMAAKGAMVQTKEGARVVLFNGNRQTVDKATHKLSILYFDRYVFDLAKSVETDNKRYREPRERDLHELLNIHNFAEGMGPKEFGKFIVEGHKRLVSPLTALGYTLVGLACLIASSFSRRTQTRQISVAIAIMVALQGSALGLDNLVAKNLALVPLLYVHVLAPIFAGFFFMIQPQRRRRTNARPQTA
jgi:lipopolysaccharide export system permease protein